MDAMSATAISVKANPNQDLESLRLEVHGSFRPDLLP